MVLALLGVLLVLAGTPGGTLGEEDPAAGGRGVRGQAGATLAVRRAPSPP